MRQKNPLRRQEWEEEEENQNGEVAGNPLPTEPAFLISMRPGQVACSGTLHRKTSQAPRTSIHRWNRSG